MSFGLSIALFFVIGVLYIGIVEFFTMLLRITGLTQEKARFQVISLLTNSGYSTQESELIVKVLPRRRIARSVMLFGYVFSITIVSVFVNALVALPNSEKEEVWVPLLIVSVLFVILMLLRRVPVVRTAYNAVLEEWGRRWLRSDEGNPILLQEEFPKGVIAAVTLNRMPPALVGKTLGELRLGDRYGLNMIYVRRNNAILVDLKDSLEFEPRDEVVVYGDMKDIRAVFAYRPPEHENDVQEAAKPESANAFIHEMDLETARQAAHAAREAEMKRAEATRKPDSAGPAPVQTLGSDKPSGQSAAGGPSRAAAPPAAGPADAEKARQQAPAGAEHETAKPAQKADGPAPAEMDTAQAPQKTGKPAPKTP